MHLLTHIQSARICHTFCAGTLSHAGDVVVSKPNPVSALAESIFWWSERERDSSGVITTMKQINKVTKYTAFEERVKATLEKTSLK